MVTLACHANILRASLYPGPFMSSANLVADARAWSKCFMLSTCLSIWAMASAERNTFVIYHRSWLVHREKEEDEVGWVRTG